MHLIRIRNESKQEKEVKLFDKSHTNDISVQSNIVPGGKINGMVMITSNKDQWNKMITIKDTETNVPPKNEKGEYEWAPNIFRSAQDWNVLVIFASDFVFQIKEGNYIKLPIIPDSELILILNFDND